MKYLIPLIWFKISFTQRNYAAIFCIPALSSLDERHVCLCCCTRYIFKHDEGLAPFLIKNYMNLIKCCVLNEYSIIEMFVENEKITQF